MVELVQLVQFFLATLAIGGGIAYIILSNSGRRWLGAIPIIISILGFLSPTFFSPLFIAGTSVAEVAIAVNIIVLCIEYVATVMLLMIIVIGRYKKTRRSENKLTGNAFNTTISQYQSVIKKTSQLEDDWFKP